MRLEESPRRVGFQLVELGKQRGIDVVLGSECGEKRSRCENIGREGEMWGQESAAGFAGTKLNRTFTISNRQWVVIAKGGGRELVRRKSRQDI